jgi:CBS domain containing-hemolysin-like protein
MTAFLILLAASGLLLFATIELAFTRLMRLPDRLEAERASEGNSLSAYLEDPLRFFIPSRLIRGGLFVLTLVLLAQQIDHGLMGFLVLFGSGVAITIALGQVVPALVVRHQPERVLELLLPVFTTVANLVGPITALIISFVGVMDRAERMDHGAEAPSHAQTAGAATDAPAAAESRLLRSVVDFGETLVREVMTPRPDIVAIRSDATFEQLRQIVIEQEYSRLPVYTDNLDNIVGLVVVKDLIQQPEQLPGTTTVTKIMRQPSFVPETKRVVDVLREFQQKRVQLAIVVDEYGGTAGLVTVEDVIEELVGEIRDEYDSEAEPIVREKDDQYVFSAKVAIGELVDRLGVEVDDGEFETIGGYVLARVGRVPAVGERFTFDGMDVEILEAERRRVHKVRLSRTPVAANAEES